MRRRKKTASTHSSSSAGSANSTGSSSTAKITPADAPAVVKPGKVDPEQPHEFVIGDADACTFCGHFADHPVHNAQLRA